MRSRKSPAIVVSTLKSAAYPVIVLVAILQILPRHLDLPPGALLGADPVVLPIAPLALMLLAQANARAAADDCALAAMRAGAPERFQSAGERSRQTARVG